MSSASKRALVATFAAAMAFVSSAQQAPSAASSVVAAPSVILCMPGFHLKYVCTNGVCHYICVRNGT